MASPGRASGPPRGEDMSVLEELARWEAGFLSREELLASYASRDKSEAGPWETTLEKDMDRSAVERSLTPMLDLHERLTAIGNEPVAYHESDWDELRNS